MGRVVVAVVVAPTGVAADALDSEEEEDRQPQFLPVNARRLTFAPCSSTIVAELATSLPMVALVFAVCGNQAQACPRPGTRVALAIARTQRVVSRIQGALATSGPALWRQKAGIRRLQSQSRLRSFEAAYGGHGLPLLATCMKAARLANNM